MDHDGALKKGDGKKEVKSMLPVPSTLAVSELNEGELYPVLFLRAETLAEVLLTLL